MALSDEQIEELRTKHGRIEHVRHKGGQWEVVYRAPKPLEYKMFRKNANNPATSADAQEMLARAIVVHPEREEFAKLLETWPALPEASSGAIASLLGLAVEETGK